MSSFFPPAPSETLPTQKKRSSLFQSITSSSVHTYAAGQDGGDLATLAFELARTVKASDHKLSDDELSEYMTATDDDEDSDKGHFNFKFSGVSVWLELDDEDPTTQELQSVIDHFQEEAGEPSFPVHATVLYNMDKELLHGGDEGHLLEKLEEVVSKLPSKYILLTPKRLIYFPYPVSADNGCGFGCLMPFFQMSLSPPLVHLFETTKNNFPPDERHGKGVPLRRCKSMNDILVEWEGVTEQRIHTTASNVEDDDNKNGEEGGANGIVHPLMKKGRSGSFHSLQGGKAYTPHVSIAYLDMSRTDLMNEEVCEKLVKGKPGLMKPVQAKYISAWWTEGQVKDWKRICRVKLC
ncbi:hypothetical protein TrCOL_g4676 [Triparma columacea]|uniref:Uncharacterized protein n=1 Tax=Triparma columacea TaxID=722753 RepID=A0A9W7LCM0_9STRA|nr:hypothetical protein TrCOL_g4676 [Triparma columacea]